MINIIVAACAENMVIGCDNDLPWNHPADLKRFKKLTIGHDVLMGRRTYLSILKRLGKPLPGRHSYVCSKTIDFSSEDGQVSNVSDIDKFFENEISTIKKYYGEGSEKDLWIIGGAEIYEHSMKYADRIYMTAVRGRHEGDTYFPDIDRRDWELAEYEISECNKLTYLIFERRFKFEDKDIMNLEQLAVSSIINSMCMVSNELKNNALPITKAINASIEKNFYNHYNDYFNILTKGYSIPEDDQKRLYGSIYETTVRKIQEMSVPSNIRCTMLSIYTIVVNLIESLKLRIEKYVAEQKVLANIERDFCKPTLMLAT